MSQSSTRVSNRREMMLFIGTWFSNLCTGRVFYIKMTLSTSADELQRMLHECQTWSEKARMQINAQKPECVFITAGLQDLLQSCSRGGDPWGTRYFNTGCAYFPRSPPPFSGGTGHSFQFTTLDWRSVTIGLNSVCITGHVVSAAKKSVFAFPVILYLIILHGTIRFRTRDFRIVPLKMFRNKKCGNKNWLIKIATLC